jgi:uncharacterized protein
MLYSELEDSQEKREITGTMIYTAAFMHDIGLSIQRNGHGELGARIFYSDENFKKFFTEKEIKMINEAIEDHRASLKGEPRNLLGKIISQADRPMYLSYVQTINRSIGYNVIKEPDMSAYDLADHISNHLCDKFGNSNSRGNKIRLDVPSVKKFIEKRKDWFSKKHKIRAFILKMLKNDSYY